MTWFTEVALDGVVSGIIGGAVTGAAVWWTLRSERKSTAMAELRVAVGRFQSITLRAGSRLIEAQTQDELNVIVEDVFEAAVATEAFAWLPAPKLARDMSSFVVAWSAAFSDFETSRAAAIPLVREATARAYGWLSDPKEYQDDAAAPRWKTIADEYEAQRSAEFDAEETTPA